MTYNKYEEEFFKKIKPFVLKIGLKCKFIAKEFDVLIYNELETKRLYLEVKSPGGGTKIQENQVNILENEIQDGEWTNVYIKKGKYFFIIFASDYMFKKPSKYSNQMHKYFRENNVQFMIIEPEFLRDNLLVKANEAWLESKRENWENKKIISSPKTYCFEYSNIIDEKEKTLKKLAIWLKNQLL
ncbi:MAG: hypothetical protein EAX96_06640 [Candidatus Lokiarchaeota archaeon]|nr:hypothetical protein [Candidatus Lokiarchaeota archaeon]